MRILLVSSLWPPRVLGGAEIYAARLLAELRNRGHEAWVVTMGVDGPNVAGVVPAWPYALDEFEAAPTWRRIAFRAVDIYNPGAVRVLHRAISDLRPDVVHTHSVTGLSTGALTVASRSGVRHVHHLHDYWLLCRRTTFVQRSGKSCDQQCASCRVIATGRSALLTLHPPAAVIAPSDAIAERHSEVAWMSGRIRRLDHPVDRIEGATEPRRAGPGQKTFGYLGQLTIPKGVTTLLHAFGPLGVDGHRLLVAGRGPLLDAVRRGGAGIEARGWVDGPDKERFFKEIDCLVVPSEWPENAPLVVLEARSHGLPVIGARIGGIPELVDVQSRQLLFPPGDAVGLRASLDAFVHAPLSFAPDPSSGMTWEDHVEALTDIYRSSPD